MRSILRLFVLLTALFLLFAAGAAAQGLNFKLKSIDGRNKVELAEALKIGPAVISFWATWCHPCQEELIQIQRIYEVYKDSGLSFFAVSIDDAKTAGKVKAVALGKRLTMTVLLDPEQQAMQDFGLASVPGVYIIGPEGQKLYEHTGYKPGDEKALEDNIRAILKLAPKSGGGAVGDTTACGADSSGCPAKEK